MEQQEVATEVAEAEIKTETETETATETAVETKTEETSVMTTVDKEVDPNTSNYIRLRGLPFSAKEDDVRAFLQGYDLFMIGLWMGYSFDCLSSVLGPSQIACILVVD